MTIVQCPEYRPLTKFEQRGLRLGHGVWDLLNWHNRWANKKTLAHPTKLDVSITFFDFPRLVALALILV